MDERASAIIVALPIPRRIEAIRREHVPVARLGVPPHVTILYPFLPRRALTAAVRGELASIASEFRAFDVRFESVGRWPGVVYLEPRPRARFTALIDRVAARWPEYPPYAGTIDDVIPHLTIAEAEGPLDDILAAVPSYLPIVATATGLEVIAETGDERWRSRWRLPFRP